MKLWHKVTLGLILGIGFGLVAGDYTNYVKPIGDMFLNAIRMIIAPLIFFSLVTGITSISDPASLGRIGVKSILAYLATTSFAIIIGIGLAEILKPGVGANLDFSQINNIPDIRVVKEFNLTSLIVGIIPHNALLAFVEGNMLQIVFFSTFTGITLVKMGDKGKPLVELFQKIAQLIFKMVSIIIQFSPYGAFALTSWIVAEQGAEVLYSLSKLISSVLIGMIIQYMIFGVFIRVFAGLKPWPFYKKSIEYQSIAFSTSSSKATLATTMKVCQDKLGVSNSSTSFVLPLGAAMNMDGMAIYLGMCAIFFAQSAGIELQTHDYIVIMLTATLGSIGGAGVPGSSMIMLPMVLTSVNIPIEGVALIAGIDRILDMVRTTINITGDATITLIIDKTEGQLDEKKYYSDN